MYAAWQENERMKREVAELQIKLEQMKKEKELDQLIEMQVNHLLSSLLEQETNGMPRMDLGDGPIAPSALPDPFRRQF